MTNKKRIFFIFYSIITWNVYSQNNLVLHQIGGGEKEIFNLAILGHQEIIPEKINDSTWNYSLNLKYQEYLYIFIDNITTPTRETIEDLLATSLKAATDSLDKLSATGKLAWAKAKDTHISHLLKVIDPFSRLHLPVGGGKGVINATTSDHGPSWRMVVHMTDNIEAYGIYPGGQSGNPGSRFYDDSVDDWVAGKYHTLWLMKKEEATDPRIKWTMHFTKG